MSRARKYSCSDWCAAAARWRKIAWVCSGTSLICMLGTAPLWRRKRQFTTASRRQRRARRRVAGAAVNTIQNIAAPAGGAAGALGGSYARGPVTVTASRRLPPNLLPEHRPGARLMTDRDLHS
jgi:hypothetical protein